MRVDDQLIEQWGPKVHAMMRGVSIIGMDYEDVAQELRISLMGAAEKYDESRGIKFHTFVHTIMSNRIRTLMQRAKSKLPLPSSLDDLPQIPKGDAILESFILNGISLEVEEKRVINYVLEGYKIMEISSYVGSYKRFCKIRESLKIKLGFLKE